MQNNVLIVIGCILLLLSPVAAIASKKVFDNSKASAEWPSTQGTIVYSQLEAHVNPRKAKAKVRYQFSINDRSYSGDRIRFADTTGNGKSIQQGVVDTYHVGKQVDVFYQPDKPSNCVLVRGGGVFAFLIFIPLLLLLGLGGYLLTAGILGKKKAIAQKKRKPTRKPMRAKRRAVR